MPTQQKAFFFDKEGDTRMEAQNVKNWHAVLDHVNQARREKSLPDGELDFLDVGCHTGGLLRLAEKQLGSMVKSLQGIEPIDKVQHEAQRQIPKGRFFVDIEQIPDESVDVVLSQEALYLVPNLAKWMAELKRILRPDGGAFIALGSHGENTAWLRWRPRLYELYGHTSYVYYPIYILKAADAVGLEAYVSPLHSNPTRVIRYSPPENGWGEFKSVQEMEDFYSQWKKIFIFYPKR